MPRPRGRSWLRRRARGLARVLLRDNPGDRSVPACTSPRRLRCVIASSVLGDTPAPGAPFGRAADTPGHEVLCTHPASLGADRRRTVTTLLRREPFPPLLGAGLRLPPGGAPPAAATPWLQPADRYSVRCARVGGAHGLLARPRQGARRLIASPTRHGGCG